MSQIVERSSLDLRYQSYRLRNDAAEVRLLASIIERGIQEPLKGVDVPQGRRLLDGFRRYRCAEKLHIECVPYVSLGEEEATGIIHLMRVRPTETAQHSRTSQVRRRTPCDARHERRRRGRGAVTQQGLGQRMPRPAEGDEPGRPGDSVSRRLSRLLVHGHLAAVHAHERRRTERDRTVRPGRGRPAAQRAGDRTVGPRLLPRTRVAAAGDRQGNWKWSLEQMRAVPEDPEGCNEVERALLQELERAAEVDRSG